MIVGLAGLKNSGKDTVGAYLVKKHSFERRSFADKLKESASALFDIPVYELEKMKNDPTCVIGVGRNTDANKGYIYAFNEPQTVRLMLQRYGTEAHRSIFGPDFWVDQLFPVGGFYGGRAIVVTDCRFQNELDRIKLLNGKTVFVERPALDLKDPHSSEGLRPEWCDYKLDNSGTVEDLFKRVEVMLDEFA